MADPTTPPSAFLDPWYSPYLNPQMNWLGNAPILPSSPSPSATPQGLLPWADNAPASLSLPDGLLGEGLRRASIQSAADAAAPRGSMLPPDFGRDSSSTGMLALGVPPSGVTAAAQWGPPNPARMSFLFGPPSRPQSPTASDDPPNATPADFQLAQWFAPLVETVKPMIDGGADTLGAKVAPLPPLPKGMPPGAFGRLLKWGKQLEAEQWSERITKDPQFTKEIVKELKASGITKDLVGRWSQWYKDSFDKQPTAEQFRHRSEGLRRLQEQYPDDGSSVPAVPPVFSCPSGRLCT